MEKEKETNQLRGNETHNFEFIYSPRTEYANKLEKEEILFNDLTLNFDPITIKIIKKHFKERLGSLNRDEFIAILKNHLLSWHPNMPNREMMLIKLLGRLFSEIDLNDNGAMEWAEFTNYIIHNSNTNSKNSDNTAYRLRWYSGSKTTIDNKEFGENISYCFYVEKFNLIGIVFEGKSMIHFFDANTNRKLKCFIELKEVQKDIDDLEIQELDIRAEAQRKREDEEKEKLRIENLKDRKRYHFKFGKHSTSVRSRSDSSKSRQHEDPILNSSPSEKENRRYSLEKNFSKSPKKSKKLPKRDEEGTPDNLKRELEKIRRAQVITVKAGASKKLTALCAYFLNEYDVLLVSSTNNKISAWKYVNGEFKNVNTIRDHFNLDKSFFLCAILMTTSPQYSMGWDPIQRHLYTGQKDGKILKWELTKSSPIGVLDIAKAKEKKEREMRKGNKKMNFNGEEDFSDDGVSKTKSFEFGSLTYEKKSKLYLRELGNDQKNASKLIKRREYEKRDSVSSILLLGKLQLLAVSYFNGHIILWDTLLMNYRKYYHDQETGVYSMTYDVQKNLLFTCGFDHDIYIYDPYIDGSAVYKLEGHNSSINSIVCNEKDSELLSLDIFGNIKVWDTQALINFQTINLNEAYDMKKVTTNQTKKISSNLRMIYLHKHKKIMVYCENNIFFFETDKSLNPELADDQIIFACFYDRITKSILSFCLRKIKIWSPFTGKLKKVYDDPMENEITALAIDRNMKRSFLGDNMGKIKNFNMKNGKLLKELASHSMEINMIVHSLTLNIVVSCSIDNIIKIHDDKELIETSVIKELVMQGNQVKALAISDKFSRLAIGMSNGIIKFYDIEHFRFDSDSSHSESNDTTKHNDEVTCLTNLEDAEIIFSGHASGLCKFMLTPPSIFKFLDLTSFYNISEKDQEKHPPITCVDIDYQNQRMFTGDQVGYINCYSIINIYEVIKKAKSTLDSKKLPSDPILTEELIKELDRIPILRLWSTEAHKESIKHIQHVNIDPSIIISTSHDLRIKLFSSETGAYIDDLKQISSKFKPVPIGIKYKIIDHFQKNKNDCISEEIAYRKDLNPFALQTVDDTEGQQVDEYQRKITELNAKEKLWQMVKGSNVTGDQSNKWNFMINVRKVIEEEENALREAYAIVKQKEGIILQTERIMQTKSIYHESYKPLFVNEMDESQLKEFSNVLSQKLRHVKLAISKANLGQNKFSSMAEFDNIKNASPNNKGKTKEKENHASKNKPKLKPISKDKIKSLYAFSYQKILTPAEEFTKCKTDFESGIMELHRPFQMLMKKTKIKPLDLNPFLSQSASVNSIEEKKREQF